jgi:hypothetical protein
MLEVDNCPVKEEGIMQPTWYIKGNGKWVRIHEVARKTRWGAYILKDRAGNEILVTKDKVR